MKSIKISSLHTFGRLPFTPNVLNAFTIYSDEMWKYFAIRVCTGYGKVGHSPLLLYYELLLALITYIEIIFT